MTHALPITDILSPLAQHLIAAHNALVIAPPGAGKSTVLPLHLSQEKWATGQQIIILQPRRIAVRSVAQRLAHAVGTQLGQDVGYQMRDDSKVSGRSHIIVMTEGVFRRRILADPELTGVAAVLFDEFHERSLDADLALALCRDVQAALRPTLKLIILSATLSAADIAPRLPDFKLFQSAGRSFAIETRYLPPDPNMTLSQSLARAAGRALADTSGNILCFLPGLADIHQAHNALEAKYNEAEYKENIALHVLHGSQTDAQQRNVLALCGKHQRSIILATDIAETSLTVPGVTCVIDSGLRRQPQFDNHTGLTVLSRTAAAIDRIDQRRGRAGRTAPGLCIRLWAAQKMRALPATTAPDVETQDLADVVLGCADWGVCDLMDLRWVTAPPQKQVSAARQRLEALGLITGDGTITAVGRLAAKLPMAIDLAAMLINACRMAEGHDTALAQDAALLCAVLSDGTARSAGCVDLSDAVTVLHARTDARAKSMRRRARQWQSDVAAAGLSALPAQHNNPALLLAQARPQLLAKRRRSASFKLAAGRGAFLERAPQLENADYLVVGDAVLSGTEVRINSAWALDAAQVERHLAGSINVNTQLREHQTTGKLQAIETRRIGAITVSTQTSDLLPGAHLADMLLEMVEQRGLDALAWPDSFTALRARADFARMNGADVPDFSDAGLLSQAELWLKPLLLAVDSLSGVAPAALINAITQIQDYVALQRLDRFAPTHFELPSGGKVPIDYTAQPAPTVAAKLQAFFGIKTHPNIANGSIALVITLLSPAGRPLQSTQDLPGFWRGGYAALRKEIRGRYPKHPWPEDPINTAPTLRTKQRLK